MRVRPHVVLSAALAVALLSLSVSGSMNNDAACANLTSIFSASVTPVTKASVPSNVCASVWATGVGKARGLLALPSPASGDLLAVSSATSSIVWLRDVDHSGSIDQPNERKVLVSLGGLNHGIILWTLPTGGGATGAYLLASTVSTVYWWPFDLSNPSATLSSTPSALVSGIPSGGHVTRTLEIDPAQRWLYVSIGSDANIDTSNRRSLIWRFDLTNRPTGGAAFQYNNGDGQLFAGGLRNEVALAWDKYGVLWGAENGADNLARADIGGDVHQDNPGEEVNKFAAPVGSFYGYPYCWSEYLLAPPYGQGAGTQWAWPSFMADGSTDAWCRNTSNVVPPAAVMPAHTAPLGMKFVNSTNSTDKPFAFPQAQTHLVVALHGSWNRDPAQGYRVVRYRMRDAGPGSGGAASGMQIDGSLEAIFAYDDDDRETGPEWGRPVDVAVGSQGEIFVSDDAVGRIVVLRYLNNLNQTGQQNTHSDTAQRTACATWAQEAVGV
jgi:glucose/arabinose dehydrogenase